MYLDIQYLSDNALREHVNEIIFHRGKAYYEQGRVTKVRIEPQLASFSVSGTQQYAVEIIHAKNDLQYFCSCPYAEAGRFCKHMVASAMYLRNQLRLNGSFAWKEPLDAALKELRSVPNPKPAKPYFLIFSLTQQMNVWTLLPYMLDVSRVLELTGGTVAAQSNQGIIELIEQNSWLGAQAKRVQQALNPAACVNVSPGVVSIANVIRRTEGTSNGYYYYNYTRPIEDYLTLLAGTGSPIFLGNNRNPLRIPLQIAPEPASLAINVSKTGNDDILLVSRAIVGDRQITLKREQVKILSDHPLWIVAGKEVLQIPDTEPQEVVSVFLETPEIRIPAEKETEFLEHYLLPIAEAVRIEGRQVRWEDVRTEPKKRLYLSEEEGGFIVRLYFSYNGVELPYEIGADQVTARHKQDGTWTLYNVQRNLAEEEKIYRSISGSRSGLKYLRGEELDNGFSLRSSVDIVDFLLKRIPVLMADGFEIYGEEILKTARVNRQSPTLTLIVSSGIDWFDLTAQVKFGDTDVSLKEVRRALRRKKRYIKLSDGTIGELPDEWVEKYKHLFGLGDQTETGARLSRHHLTLVEELLKKADSARTDEDFKRRLLRLKDFKAINPVNTPAGFNGELRPYQKAGYDWLHFLRHYEFGGCLADDMGLGKTVQVLVFLQSLYENGSQGNPSLVVLPRSLLFNWQREAKQFTPTLKVLEHFGTGRSKDVNDFKGYDIVLTTYGTMRRDIKLLRTYEFEYAILDESQAIKNPLSQISKSARMLNAKNRLALTGTPVENSTFELWSQFAFLNPGLLGGLEYFKREFANPIERQQDESAAEFLRHLVFPFILRRTKKQVAPELPPRTERIVYGEMQPLQKKLYNQTRDYYRDLLLGMIDDQGLDNTRMKVLEGLLRLRQISNHPVLIDHAFNGKSAKMELLLEHLDTLQSEGHKALVFSQFVQMLQLVRTELDDRDMPYVYLDGQTQDRQACVDQFQSDDSIPFFLISLRAGGVGLNLTAADYVIHIDPWWNPAVEMQAADRTHRIGQDKPVFVYKLITRDTVEEKILLLQQKKKALVDQLISTENSFFKSLNPEDIQNLFS